MTSLIAEGRLKPSRFEVRERGLEGIFEGLQGVERGEEQRDEACVPDIGIRVFRGHPQNPSNSLSTLLRAICWRLYTRQRSPRPL